jgi:porin
LQQHGIGSIGRAVLFRRRTGILAIAAAILMSGGVARAADDEPAAEGETPFDQPSVLPPNAYRAKLAESGIRWRAIYTGDLFGNVSGGISRGSTYAGRLELGMQADLSKFGWAGALFNVSIFAIHGHGITTARLGNLLAVSNAEAEPTVRLFELWLQQELGSFGSLRIGQLAADSEFIGSDTASLFINGTFGWPGITGANLPSGGPAYPLATPGARLEVNLGADTKLRAAIFNGDPSVPGAANPQTANLYGVNFRVNDDPFLIAELEHGYSASTLPGKIKLGVWYHTGKFSDQRFDTIGLSLANPGTTGIPASLRSSWGPYAVIDQTVLKLPNDRQVSAFARASFSPDDRSLVSFYIDAGLKVTNLFAKDDALGVGFAYAKISDRARGLDRDTQVFIAPGYPLRDYEAVLEVSYQYQIVDGWTIQPDFQYIFHPGGKVPDPNFPVLLRPVKDAAVFGLRSQVQF